MPQGLSPDGLIASWERGQHHDPLHRGVDLWHAAEPDASTDTLAMAPVGQRDHALLGLRIATFGPTAPCFVACPECTEHLEFELDLDALSVDPPPAPPDGPTVVVEDWHVRFRLPGSTDLAVAMAADDPLAALLRRCILAVTRDGDDAAPADLPDDVVRAVDDEMRRLDPQAAVELALDCAACGHRWTAAFDVVSFLWREIDVTARRLLWEVHVLARAYGWSERDILSLGTVRRRAYLELAGAL